MSSAKVGPASAIFGRRSARHRRWRTFGCGHYGCQNEASSGALLLSSVERQDSGGSPTRPSTSPRGGPTSLQNWTRAGRNGATLHTASFCGHLLGELALDLAAIPWAKSSRTWPSPTALARSRPNLSQTMAKLWPNLGQTWVIWAEFGPLSTEHGPESAQLWRIRPTFVRFRPSPNFAISGESLGTSGRIWLVRFRAQLARFRPQLAQIRPFWRDFDRCWTNSGQMSVKFGRCLLTWVRVRPSTARLRRNLGVSGRKGAKFGRVLSSTGP